MFPMEAVEIVELNKLLDGKILFHKENGSLIIELPNQPFGIEVYFNRETKKLVVVAEPYSNVNDPAKPIFYEEI